MTYDHWFEDCAEHAACIVHVGAGTNEQGAFRTESHMAKTIDPAFRLNLDYPDADDRRPGTKPSDRVQWRLADDDAIASDDFPWDEKERRRVAAIAAAKGLGLVSDLAAVANVDAAELVAEATTQKWIDASDAAVLDAQIASGEIAPVDPKEGGRGLAATNPGHRPIA